MTRTWPNIYSRARGDYVIDCGKMGGTKRVVYVRATREEADAKAAEMRSLRKKLGNGAKTLSSDQLLDATAAITLLSGRCSLQDAAKAWLGCQMGAGAGKTVLEAYNALVADQELREARHELRSVSVVCTRSTLKPFVAQFGTRDLLAVTRADIEQYADAIPQSTTRGNAVRYIRSLFNFARHKEWIAVSPAEMVKAPKFRYVAPRYLTVDQTEHLFNTATQHDPAILPRLALGYFAGMRPTEIERLAQSDIKPDAKLIAVRVEVSKTKHPRVVELTDQLASYLTTQPLDACPASQFQRRVKAVMKVAGLKGGHDLARHTYASHRLALDGDPAKTAHALGHISSGWSVLFAHYSAIGVTKEDADLFFKIGV